MRWPRKNLTHDLHLFSHWLTQQKQEKHGLILPTASEYEILRVAFHDGIKSVYGKKTGGESWHPDLFTLYQEFSRG